MINILSGDYSKQNFSCIYKIISKKTSKHYIGSAKHFGIRRRNHLNSLLKNKHHSIILQNHVNKYGINDLSFEILERLDWNKEIYIREQYFIDSTSPKFNVLTNATGSIGRKASYETRAKLRVSHLGIKQSEASKEKRSISCKLALAELSDIKKENRKKAGYLKRRKVVCNETNEIFISIRDAEIKTGCDNIGIICQGKRKHSLGLTFKYA